VPKVILLDNYDSFTYNLEHYLSALGAEVVVQRNDAYDGNLAGYDAVVLSPGPGLPREHANLMKVVAQCEGKIPVLGVCLGMQAIALHLRGEIGNKHEVKHGVEDQIRIFSRNGIFADLPEYMQVGLYHSWEVYAHEAYEVDARSVHDGTIMAISQPAKQMHGVQFHPESVMTPYGKEILGNFLTLVRQRIA
jgi:anthranilate synthase component 2